MKKIIHVLLITTAMIFSVGCGNKKNVSENKTSELKLPSNVDLNENVETWLKNINSVNGPSFFNTKYFEKTDAQELIDLFNGEYAYKVFYEDTDKIHLMIITDDADTRGTLTLEKQNGVFFATVDYNATSLFQDNICPTCSGTGLTVINSYQVTEKYACPLCGGSGFQETQVYDSVMGWQTQQIACSCAAGWIEGPHIVYDYAFCNDCQGFGIK